MDVVSLQHYYQTLQTFHEAIIQRAKAENPLKAHLITKPLHEGQIAPVKAIFVDGVLEMMLQCGRSFGKTELALYIAWRWAITKPNQIIYILCPQRKQGKEIYWASGRLQHYSSHDFIADELGSELRLVFKNGSFICIDGADNYDALRGIKPNLVVDDEFQDHLSEVDTAMRPNLVVKQAPLIRIGTPPDKECYYTEIREDIMAQVAAGSERHYYLELPTWENPLIDKEWLEHEKKRLYARGDGAIFEREYGARFIPGGASAVFPNFQRNKERLITPPGIVQNILTRDKKNFSLYDISDPGQTCFGVLFGGVNKYTSQIILLDELYERDRNFTSSGHMWPRTEEVCKRYGYLDKWQHYCDEAASWYRAEVYERFGVGIAPTRKKKAKGKKFKKEQISIIKDIFEKENALLISERCKMFVWEIENYVTDEKGDPLDENDHLIDDFRYLLQVAGYNLNELPYEVIVPEDEAVKRRPKPLSFNEIVKESIIREDPFVDAETDYGYFREDRKYWR